MLEKGAVMSARGRHLGVVASIVGGLAFAPAPARADVTKDQCIAANGKGQELRRERKLSAAREQLHTCADASCPAMVRDDCVKRLDELERAQPSIVFDVKDTRGIDVIDVRVSVDGQVLADHLDGSALRIDPGVHVFTFEVTGQPAVTDKLLVREGEIGRHEPVVVTVAAGAAPPGPAQEEGPPSPPPESLSAPAESGSSSGRRSTQRVVGLVTGGVGVAGLAAGTVFGLMSGSAWSKAKDACGGSTTACMDVPSGQSHRSTAEGDATVSTVAFIAGGVLLATGAVLFLTAGHEKSAATAVVVAPSLGPRQAALVLAGAFQ
jgi:hypothetical protein